MHFVYAGNEILKPAVADLEVRVPAASTIRARPRSLRNGQRVILSGRLLGGWIPPQGKVVELQAFYRRKWRTFGTTRAGQLGDWRYAYRFEVTRGRVTYRFRAQIESEAGYPFQTGLSPVMAVVVRG
jgi:hypothetical protein